MSLHAPHDDLLQVVAQLARGRPRRPVGAVRPHAQVLDALVGSDAARLPEQLVQEQHISAVVVDGVVPPGRSMSLSMNTEATVSTGASRRSWPVRRKICTLSTATASSTVTMSTKLTRCGLGPNHTARPTIRPTIFANSDAAARSVVTFASFFRDRWSALMPLRRSLSLASS